jgi:hypothetical protein
MPAKLKICLALAASAAAASAAVLPAATASAQPARPGRAGTVAAAAAASLPRITIAMTGKKIAVSGALQSGGVEVASRVSHESQGDPVLVRLDPGVTVAQFLAALPKIANDPNNLYGVGSLVFSVEAGRGTSVAQVSLAAGQYVALDLNPSGQPPLTSFKIATASAPAALPKPAATVASIEFGFRGPGVLHDGALVRFANQGFLVHMIVAARARNLAGAREIARLLKAGKDGRAQKLATGFATYDNALSHGAYEQLVLHSKPGYWVLACFMDTQDHREHTQLGMERVIRIVK